MCPAGGGSDRAPRVLLAGGAQWLDAATAALGETTVTATAETFADVVDELDVRAELGGLEGFDGLDGPVGRVEPDGLEGRNGVAADRLGYDCLVVGDGAGSDGAADTGGSVQPDDGPSDDGNVTNDDDGTGPSDDDGNVTNGDDGTGPNDDDGTGPNDDDGTGPSDDIGPIALVETVRERDPDLPIVVAPADGSERLASRALAAGATDYVPLDGEPTDLVGRLTDAIAEAAGAERRRRAADRFETLFDDRETFQWVTDGAGRVRDANAAARNRFGPLGPDVALVEHAGFDPADAAAIEDALGEALEEALGSTKPTGREGGGSGSDRARVDLDATLDGDVPVEVTVRPVDGAGEAIVEAVDVTRRSQLEAELRRSERLHRITLNNMTDTVLVTDDEGRFTYVCPNVHFIFGYTAQEIHDLGRIDALLGEDLFEPEELAEESVLTNLECTAADKEGEEHALLVNVKEVSIQGGTRLYSCRDITKRKERERALSTLHDTARELLYAASRPEAAELLAGDVRRGLPIDAAACYLYDEGENVLRPAAATPSFERGDGPPSEVSPGTDTIVGRTFVRGEVERFDDLREAALPVDVAVDPSTDERDGPPADLRAAAFVPIGDHGVLVVGCEVAGAIDDVTVELADLFAATAEAGLDRIDRESALRAQEEELTRRNERLVELDRTNHIIREVDRALVQAETREEIERAVCERLTAEGRFELAWVAERTPTGVEVRAAAGGHRGYLDSLPEDVRGTSEPAYEALRGGEPVTVSNVARRPRAADWRVEALSRGLQSVASVPLQYEGATYGVLTVYAADPGALDDPIGDVLVELGGTIASAIGSVNRRNALLGGTVTELTYGVTDPDCLLYALAGRTGAELAIEGGVEPLGDRVLTFATVDGADPEEVAAAAREFVAVDDARAIATAPDGGTLRLELARPFVGTALADHGAVLRRFDADRTAARLVVDVPVSTPVRTVDELVSGWYDAPELLSRRERSLDQERRPRLRSTLAEELTDRQLEAAWTAYHSGYFESPREATGEDVADALGVSSTAFYRLNRTAQRRLFEALFDEQGLDIEG